jgi:hypothetical protein
MQGTGHGRERLSLNDRGLEHHPDSVGVGMLGPMATRVRGGAEGRGSVYDQ